MTHLPLFVYISFLVCIPGVAQTQTSGCPAPAMAISTDQTNRPSGVAMMQAYREMMKNTALNSDAFTFDRSETDQTWSKSGTLARTRRWDYQVFFVNGYAISETVAVNGKPVPAKKLKQEFEVAKKQIAKDATAPPKRQYYSMYYDQDALEHGHLDQPQRIIVDGRPVVAYRLAGNLNGVSSGVAKDYEGIAWFDEKTDALQYLSFKTRRELKFSGDTMALRPGFEFASRYINIDGSHLWIWSCAQSIYNAHKGPFTDIGENFWKTSNIRKFDIRASSSQ